MFKIVVVAGKLRGKEFILKDGENTLGRSTECDVCLPVEGVSKKHLSLTVSSDGLYLKDLNSSNGTFLNGALIKSATAADGDKLAFPDIIAQVVHVREKKIIIKKQAVSDELDDYLKGGSVPNNLFAKIIYAFKYKLMPVLHGINEEYEWRSLFGFILAVFGVLTITMTIFPVLQDSKKILLYETKLRGVHYAEEIGRMNSKALEQKQLDRVDTNFMDDEDGVQSYILFDMEGRIVRPINRLNEYISDPFSIAVKEWAQSKESGDDASYETLLSDGEIGIGKKILAFNASLAAVEPVGVIAIRFAPRTLAVEATNSSKLYLESLVTCAIVAIIFFGVVYYLTLRPIDEMKYQIEESLRGKRKNLESKYQMSEIKSLRESINSLLQRNRELAKEEAENNMAELESDESYLATLSEIIRGAGVPAMILNSEKNVSKINLQAEDITGIRESVAQGMSLLDVSREKGFAATLIELCDSSASSNGSCQEGEYEIQGRPYKIFVTSLIGKDSFAKAFYITFVLEA